MLGFRFAQTVSADEKALFRVNCAECGGDVVPFNPDLFVEQTEDDDVINVHADDTVGNCARPAPRHLRQVEQNKVLLYLRAIQIKMHHIK